MLDFQVTYDKLAQFQTPQEIREFFQGQGVKGITCNLTKCPIASFIRRETGELVSVDSYIILRMKNRNSLSLDHYVVTTPAMERFIENFDDEEYPELILNLEEDY